MKLPNHVLNSFSLTKWSKFQERSAKENSSNSAAIQQGFFQHDLSIRGILFVCWAFLCDKILFQIFDTMVASGPSTKMEVKKVKNVQLISNQTCEPPKFRAIH